MSNQRQHSECRHGNDTATDKRSLSWSLYNDEDQLGNRKKKGALCPAKHSGPSLSSVAVIERLTVQHPAHSMRLEICHGRTLMTKIIRLPPSPGVHWDGIDMPPRSRSFRTRSPLSWSNTCANKPVVPPKRVGKQSQPPCITTGAFLAALGR
jgi:hypothetical protein